MFCNQDSGLLDQIVIERYIFSLNLLEALLSSSCNVCMFFVLFKCMYVCMSPVTCQMSPAGGLVKERVNKNNIVSSLAIYGFPYSPESLHSHLVCRELHKNIFN